MERTDPPSLGRLELVPVVERLDLVAAPVAVFLKDWRAADEVWVASIDPDLADTAACVVLATSRADVNGVVRRRLDARKASFAPMDDAVRLTGMEHGGITPPGLPTDWPVRGGQRGHGG